MNSNLFYRLLNYYHISEDEYRQLIAPVTEDTFALGHRFDHIDEALALIQAVMKENGKIFIYGDYDADGVMGTSILVKMFQYQNYEVSSYLPNRYEDGYGLTLKKAQEAIKNGIKLVITVDNGITAFEPIELLKKNGVHVLIIDHHQAQDELPNADYIIHPILSHFGKIPSSGAFTAFMFSMAFLGRYDKYLATLAAISLISDIMPLLDYNRNLLRLVISQYREGEFPALDVLKENEPFNEVTIGLKIAPKINAIGRLIDGSDINRLVSYFTDKETDKLLNYASWIFDVNEKRKIASKTASESLENLSAVKEEAIVFISEAKEGLLGLIANQLCSKYQKPTLVLTYDKSGDILKGSCRAPEGFNVVETFKKLQKYLLSFGGHALAGGCTLKVSDYQSFRQDFLHLVRSTPLQPVIREVIDLRLTEINEENYRLIQTFSPFGEGWSSPLFSLKRISVSSLFFSRDGHHLITQIGQNVRLTGFNISRDSLSKYQFVDMIGNLRINQYRGNRNIEFLIAKIKESSNI
ncbi:MAG: DHH family phosphoesterase [Bacilli bacterium]